MVGSKIVLSGRQLTPAAIASLVEGERATFTAGVPTLWMGLYSFLEHEKHDVSSLRTIVCAGSALPRQIRRMVRAEIRDSFYARVGHDGDDADRHGGGAQEPSRRSRGQASIMIFWPVTGSRSRVSASGLSTSPARNFRGTELRWASCRYAVPWVTSGYYKDPRGEERGRQESFMDGWFRTGDVATIDAEGYIQIMDRTKDLVKSGGEWISSVDLENAIMAHPKVMEAAVIAVPHPKWEERPVAAVAPLPQYRGQITKEEILDFLKERVPKWWLPDDVVFIDAVPKTSVGKFNKRGLREQFKDYKLPGVAAAG